VSKSFFLWGAVHIAHKQMGGSMLCCQPALVPEPHVALWCRCPSHCCCCRVLQGRDMVINLIPWNPVYQPDGPFFAAPAEGAVEAFQRILRGTYGLHCTIRQEKGQDISGVAGSAVHVAASSAWLLYRGLVC
jgi:hypothetical protein